jgi:hypothetical protein
MRSTGPGLFLPGEALTQGTQAEQGQVLFYHPGRYPDLFAPRS